MKNLELRIQEIANSPHLNAGAKARHIAGLRDWFPKGGLIEPLFDALVEKGFRADLCLTSNKFHAFVAPSLEGAELEECDEPLFWVRRDLKRRGRRPATVVESMLYGANRPEELRQDSVILTVDEAVDVDTFQCLFALYLGDDGERYARMIKSFCIPVIYRVLHFPMTPEELAARDAEDAEGRSA